MPRPLVRRSIASHGLTAFTETSKLISRENLQGPSLLPQLFTLLLYLQHNLPLYLHLGENFRCRLFTFHEHADLPIGLLGFGIQGAPFFLYLYKGGRLPFLKQHRHFRQFVLNGTILLRRPFYELLHSHVNLVSQGDASKAEVFTNWL